MRSVSNTGVAFSMTGGPVNTMPTRHCSTEIQTILANFVSITCRFVVALGSVRCSLLICGPFDLEMQGGPIVTPSQLTHHQCLAVSDQLVMSRQTNPPLIKTASSPLRSIPRPISFIKKNKVYNTTKINCISNLRVAKSYHLEDSTT
jgi:hypothetical protein